MSEPAFETWQDALSALREIARIEDEDVLGSADLPPMFVAACEYIQQRIEEMGDQVLALEELARLQRERAELADTARASDREERQWAQTDRDHFAAANEALREAQASFGRTRLTFLGETVGWVEGPHFLDKEAIIDALREHDEDLRGHWEASRTSYYGFKRLRWWQPRYWWALVHSTKEEA